MKIIRAIWLFYFLTTIQKTFANVEISRIYSRDNNKFIFETSSKPSTEILDSKIIFLDTKINHSIAKNISDIFQIIQKSDSLEIITPNKSIIWREVFPNFAYELEITENPISSKTSTDSTQIEISAFQSDFYRMTKSKSGFEDFVDKLDPDLKFKLKNDLFLQEDIYSKIDSASLQSLAQYLETLNQKSKAYDAYRLALEFDPKNISARLGLARTATNDEEALSHLFKTFDDEALQAVASLINKQGSAKSTAQSFIPYQFAILKNPEQGQYRFNYAKALEKAGTDFWQQASQRYLEAAALAKKAFLVNHNSIDESLMRSATEGLIKILILSGRKDEALKYCNSYLNLGYQNFITGQKIIFVMNAIKNNHNPFWRT